MLLINNNIAYGYNIALLLDPPTLFYILSITLSSSSICGCFLGHSCLTFTLNSLLHRAVQQLGIKYFQHRESQLIFYCLCTINILSWAQQQYCQDLYGFQDFQMYLNFCAIGIVNAQLFDHSFALSRRLQVSQCCQITCTLLINDLAKVDPPSYLVRGSNIL